MISIKRLEAEEANQFAPNLAAVLVDCVEGGASVNFMAGYSAQEAERFFRGVAADVETGKRQLYAAFEDLRIVGSVQVILASPPNQPHRGELAKLLVHRDARKRGVGTRLVSAAEVGAREAGKSLLVLDTVEGDPAERLYERGGWVRVGVIPDYALYPDGRLCNTVVFYKRI